ncbi:MAG: hypothetical protein VKJ24_09435 [Synechococcales bacterium]|nr:hypothetical protein [Synechococcales bacterium]
MDNLTLALDRLTTLVEQSTERSNARLNQHDQKLDDQDARTERLERILETHETKMEELRATHEDIRTILQMMTRRFSGEPPVP